MAETRPARPRPLPLLTTVVDVAPLTPAMTRIVVSANDWSDFAEPVAADSYVKIVFLSPDVAYPRPIDPARIRAEMPAEHWPRLRTYTVRNFDREHGTLTLDFVTHGGEGLAGAWASRAKPGDEVLISGPGGGYTPDTTADWHLLAGDESALPAIAVALERLPADATGTAIIEVPGSEDCVALTHPVGVDIAWVHRGHDDPGAHLVPAVRAWNWPAGTGQFFVHGEAGVVKELRRYLRVERGVEMDRLSISGYWRRGVDDEGWRQVKRAWNKAIDESEADAAAGAA